MLPNGGIMASTDVDTVSAVMDQNPYESPREPSGRFVHGSGEQQPAHKHDGKAEVTMWWKRALTIASITALCLYVGSFLLFRAFPQEFSLAHRDDPQHYIVTFADNVEVHSALRKFYW